MVFEHRHHNPAEPTNQSVPKGRPGNLDPGQQHLVSKIRDAVCGHTSVLTKSWSRQGFMHRSAMTMLAVSIVSHFVNLSVSLPPCSQVGFWSFQENDLWGRDLAPRIQGWRAVWNVYFPWTQGCDGLVSAILSQNGQGMPFFSLYWFSLVAPFTSNS